MKDIRTAHMLHPHLCCHVWCTPVKGPQPQLGAQRIALMGAEEQRHAWQGSSSSSSSSMRVGMCGKTVPCLAGQQQQQPS
jgi:hypothetical protein